MLRFACILLRYAIDESKGAYRQRSPDCAGRSNMDINCCKKEKGLPHPSRICIYIYYWHVSKCADATATTNDTAAAVPSYTIVFLAVRLFVWRVLTGKGTEVLWGTGNSSLPKGPLLAMESALPGSAQICPDLSISRSHLLESSQHSYIEGGTSSKYILPIIIIIITMISSLTFSLLAYFSLSHLTTHHITSCAQHRNSCCSSANLIFFV